MKAKEEDLINYYYMGVELSESNSKFPDWFEFYEEKIACLMGYNDYELGCVKDSNKEILEQIWKIK